MIVYKATNKINNKIYIGKTKKTIENRIREHLGCDKTPFHHALKKYGLNNFVVEEIDKAKNFEELNTKEKYWINFYDSIAPNGYNLTKGGDGISEPSEEINRKNSESHKGKKASFETKQKMSLAQFGKKLSEESRRKISETRKGIVFSEEHRRKLSLNNARVMLGKQHSEETKKKMSFLKMGEKNPMKRPEVKNKVSQVLLGRIAWNRGKYLSEEHILSLKKSHLGHKDSMETRAKKTLSSIIQHIKRKEQKFLWGVFGGTLNLHRGVFND